MNGGIQVERLTPKDLPAPPQAALKIVRACSNPNIHHDALSQLAASDPLLTAELLRVVNSPYFGLSREIQSIPRAVNVLGQRVLRNLALCVSVRDALKSDAIPGFDIASFWEEAIRRAVAARLLGEMLKDNGDNYFTAGLLQDFGLLIMFFLAPEAAPLWADMRAMDPDTRYGKELGEFQTTHDQIGRKLGQTWSLPADLTEAIGSHHACSADSPQLAKALLCADWMAAVYSANEKGAVLDKCRFWLADYFDIDGDAANALLAQMPHSVKEAADALGLGIEEQQDFEEIMREANLRLVEANLSYQELTWRLQQTLKERDELQSELNRELELAREIQQSLLPKSTEPGQAVYGINLSARQLSGDFYDCFALPDGRLYFNLGDVSGKGVNAALLMAKTSSLFRCLGKRINDPSQLLTVLNDELCETSTRGMFVTLCAGLYNPKTKEVIMVNAGHMPAVVHGADGKFGKLEASGPPLGVMANMTYPAKKFSIDGSSLYLFSDGVTEGHKANGEEMGFKGLLNLLRQVADLSPQDRLDRIAREFTSGDVPLRDDLTLVVVDGCAQTK